MSTDSLADELHGAEHYITTLEGIHADAESRIEELEEEIERLHIELADARDEIARLIMLWAEG